MRCIKLNNISSNVSPCKVTPGSLIRDGCEGVHGIYGRNKSQDALIRSRHSRARRILCAGTRNNLHVGIHVSTNCAISGAILPLGAETRRIIERRAVPRKRVAVVRRMLQRAHIRGVSLVDILLAGKRITRLLERVAARGNAASSLTEIRCARV